MLSRDPHTGRQEPRRVLRRFITPDQPVLSLKVRSSNNTESTLEVTGEHPFWVVGRGWIFARELRPGDRLSTSAFEALEVIASADAGRATVYNFEVEEFHTYLSPPASEGTTSTSITGTRGPPRQAFETGAMGRVRIGPG